MKATDTIFGAWSPLTISNLCESFFLVGFAIFWAFALPLAAVTFALRILSEALRRAFAETGNHASAFERNPVAA